MKTKYLDFIKLNENSHNIISIAEIEKVFRNVFDDTKVSSVKTLYDYDKIRKETKLIISINNLFYNETNIIFTKFVFIVDDKKEKLKKNQFSYLYDINCDFRTISFDDTDEMIIKMNELLEGEKFGQNLKDAVKGQIGFFKGTKFYTEYAKEKFEKCKNELFEDMEFLTEVLNSK